MKTSIRFAILASLLSFAVACGDTDEPADVGVDVVDDTEIQTDVGLPDATEDTGIDAVDDATDDADEDAVDEDVESDVLESCANEGDTCADGFICVEGLCESLACLSPGDWVRCEKLFERVETDMGRFATCTDRMCRASCYLDDDCAEGEICTDFGACRPFTGDLSLDVPFGPTTGTMQAGVANLLLNYPLGTPQGGYGTRAATNDGRYAASLRATSGQLHGLYARAVIVDNGDRHMLMMRLPVIFTQAGLHEAVARALQDVTGQDWRNDIIISSTHTHSGPCRHWHLPEEAAAPLGAFGIGEFHQIFFNWMRDKVVETALAALEDMAPAKIGWEIIEGYDVDDQVGRDRWSQTPPFDDNRALLIRIDDMDDVPRAALLSFGAHGTMNDVEYMSGDGVGRLERSFEDAIGEEFGRFAPVLFMNQNSGTMGPAGGSQGHAFPMAMERMGWIFVEKTWDTFMDMETTSELTLNSRTMRFPISYDLLGYERGAFSSILARPFGGEYHYGGLSCVGRNGGDDDYATHGELENTSCAGALQFLLYNAPPTTMIRSQMTMMEMNGLTLGTVPGELSQELAWEMQRALQDEFGLDVHSTWTLGYANDHLFYLLPTNMRGENPPWEGHSTPQPIDDYPDYAFSYHQGGYETTMSMWGPNEGDYLVDRFVETYHTMIDAAFEPARPQPLPTEYAVRDAEPFEILSTPSDIVGTWTVAPPTEVSRLETIEFAWYGGDPGAEQPQVPVVTLERNNEGWAPVILPNQREYNNLEWRFLTRVRRHADTNEWEWVVRWEELQDFPRGTYRFRIDGHYQNDAGERVAYDLTSDPIEFSGTDEIIVTPVATESGVTGTIGFPPEVRGQFQGPASDPGRATGNFRMRHPMVPTGSQPPVTALTTDDVTIELVNDAGTTMGSVESITTTAESVGGHSGVPVTRFAAVWSSTVAAGTYTLNVTVEDALGNTGTYSEEVTF